MDMDIASQLTTPLNDLLRNLEDVLKESEQHVVSDKREAFAQRARTSVFDQMKQLIRTLVKEAKECSNGGWDDLRPMWSKVFAEADEQQARLELSAPIAGENLEPNIRFIAARGNAQDLEPLLQSKVMLEAAGEKAEVVDEAARRLRRRILDGSAAQGEAKAADVQRTGWQTFRDELPSLLSQHKGRWVTFHGARRVALCDSKLEAYELLEREKCPLNEVVVSRVELPGPPVDVRRLLNLWSR